MRTYLDHRAQRLLKNVQFPPSGRRRSVRGLQPTKVEQGLTTAGRLHSAFAFGFGAFLEFCARRSARIVCHGGRECSRRLGWRSMAKTHDPGPNSDQAMNHTKVCALLDQVATNARPRDKEMGPTSMHRHFPRLCSAPAYDELCAARTRGSAQGGQF